MIISKNVEDSLNHRDMTLNANVNNDLFVSANLRLIFMIR
ncbi:hypothetical protein BN1326_100065 [Staphylococcus argenteus]|uniref:Uncharacterized protein n=1 Tax=Staphylococcus argenteus TaxID=985002 RepID=A0A7U7JQ82_9STAP|nr:hypothetical protein BN1326_100065 [Staphylococcus argenteus]CRI10395.1 hypothetical protein BN1326_100065 [Staphylococcus argenteus]